MGNKPPACGDSTNDLAILAEYTPAPWNNKLVPIQGMCWQHRQLPLPDQTAQELMRVPRPQDDGFYNVRAWNTADVTRIKCRELLQETWHHLAAFVPNAARDTPCAQKEVDGRAPGGAGVPRPSLDNPPDANALLYRKWAVILDGLHDSVQEMARRAFDREDIFCELVQIRGAYRRLQEEHAQLLARKLTVDRQLNALQSGYVSEDETGDETEDEPDGESDGEPGSRALESVIRHIVTQESALDGTRADAAVM